MSAALLAALLGLSLAQSEPAAEAAPSNASRLQDLLNAMRDDTPEDQAERQASLQEAAVSYIAEVEAAILETQAYTPATRTGEEADILAVLDQFDAWAWFDEPRALEPLVRQEPHGQPPETWPFGL